MSNLLLTTKCIECSPRGFLESVGNIFAIFDAQTQDSGNISYGVEVEHARYCVSARKCSAPNRSARNGTGSTTEFTDRFFVKTAGNPDDPAPFLPHSARVALLRNGVQLAQSIQHAALPRLHHAIESPHGPLLVYDWAAGELLHACRAQRADAQSAYQRFRHLPVAQVGRALEQIFEVHWALAAKNWIAVDFYDGSLIYDFAQHELHLVDLDNYHQGPFVNSMGRMFGSSRFMAPEEFARGALIDQRTNVFTMGRTMALFLGDGTLARHAFRGDDALYAVMLRACRKEPVQRFSSMAEFYEEWRKARG
ncbi:MAG: hypothetical protein H6645_04515 [Caldilineaceae bacterium]|nr:hypothetical protein [Caldilineaceae bacterium]